MIARVVLTPSFAHRVRPTHTLEDLVHRTSRNDGQFDHRGYVVHTATGTLTWTIGTTRCNGNDKWEAEAAWPVENDKWEPAMQ